MKIDFGMIVLNAEDFIEQTIKGVYKVAHKIIIIEGAVTNSDTGKCMVANEEGLSTDRTSEIIMSIPDPENKIIYDRVGFTENKDVLSDRYLFHADCDYIWQLDADEVYEQWVLDDVIEYLKKNRSVVCVDFIVWNFVKDFKHVGNNSNWDHPFRRIFKYMKGSEWKTHTPPELMWPGYDKPVSELGKIVHCEFTRRKGWHLHHYSYVTEKQVAEKLMYHSYRGYYRPNWVNRIWKNILDKKLVKEHGSHPFDETELYSYSRKKLGTVDLFVRKHPEIMKSHPLYKESYGKHDNPLNVAHPIHCWGAGGGCRCSYIVAKKMFELFGDTFEFMSSTWGIDPEFSVRNSFVMNERPKEIAHYINKKGFDIVDIAWWNMDLKRFREIRRHVNNIPFIATFHIYPIDGTEWDIRKKDISWFDGVVVTGTKMLKLDGLKSFYPDRIEYINSPGDAERYFKVKRQIHSGFNVLLGGTYNEGKFRKNTFDIIEELSLLGEDISFHFIGVVKSDGEYGRDIQRRFSNNKRILFKGYVDPAEILRSMDLVLNILPDKCYALSECLMQESMAAGLPTIRLGGRGSEDLVTNGVDGYFTYNKHEFVNFFKILYRNYSLREKMGKEAANTVEAMFMPEKSAVVLRDFYLKMIGVRK